MLKNDYISPFAEPLEILPECSVASSDPGIDGGPSFEGMKPEEEW